jgi:hypothetical protein
MRQMRICAMTVLGVLAIAGAAAAAPTGWVAVTVPAYVVHSKTNAYNITVRGYSRKAAIAHLFLDYSGCARTFAAEQRRASAESFGSRFYAVRGTFTKVSGWQSPWTGGDHACAYLIGRASGTQLATAHVSFVVH